MKILEGIGGIVEGIGGHGHYNLAGYFPLNPGCLMTGSLFSWFMK